MAKVDVISSCAIRTAGSNTNPISRLDLSPCDLQVLSYDSNQKGILFQNPQSKQTLIPHLKASLSRALDFFPPLAGRLATTAHDDGAISYFLDCNNAGVEFVHAIAAATSVSDILEPKYIPEIVTCLFAGIGNPNSEGVSKPLLAVQVTELIDGLFIALTANHVAVDGVSFWHFINSWSEISQGSDTISKTPVFEYSFRNGLLRFPPLEKSTSGPLPPPPPLLERVFHFSKQTLSNLKAKANSEAGTDKISSLQAMSAHLWRAASRHRYSGIRLDREEDGLTVMVGLRPRIPLPEGYFGNAAIGAKMWMSAAELMGKGIGHVALRINELVARHTKEAIAEIMEDWVNYTARMRRGGFSSMVVTSSPRHDVYGNDFGWGKPLAVRSGPSQKFDGKLTLFPAAKRAASTPRFASRPRRCGRWKATPNLWKLSRARLME